jgi:hypothetical protein
VSFTRQSCSVSLLACALALPSVVLAEGSERQTPIDEQKQQIEEANLPPAVQQFVNYMRDFDSRYPDSGRVAVDRVLAEEGESIALHYCGAIGIDGPCVPDDKSQATGFVPVNMLSANVPPPSNWWEWVRYLFGQVGVIPSANFCPAPYSMTNIYMDDENNNNNNSRSGWIGATVSNNNTLWRHCRLTSAASWQFRPLPVASSSHSYAVLSLGVFCPPGSSRYWRFQDNQGGSNGNYSTGPIFPNVNVAGRNWLTASCHFTGGNASFGTMPAFPNLGFSYGVYGPDSMPGPYALQRGWVYQDDEDFININYWLPGAPNPAIMNGSNNTRRFLVRVR